MDVNSVLKCDLEQNKLDFCCFNTAIQFEISDDIREPISRGKRNKNRVNSPSSAYGSQHV